MRLRMTGAGRCLTTGAVGLAALIATPLLPGNMSHVVGLVLGLLGAPLGLALCATGRLTRRQAIVSALVPASLAGLYEFTNLVPPPPIIEVGTWILVGALAGAAACVSARGGSRKPSGARAVILLVTATTWWGVWAVASVAGNPRIPPHDLATACTSNLRQIGIARSLYEGLRHEDAPNIEALVSAGLLPDPKWMARCPTGKPYVDLQKCRPQAGPWRSQVLLCPNHPGRLLLLDRSGRVITFLEERPWRGKVFPAWWLHVWGVIWMNP